MLETGETTMAVLFEATACSGGGIGADTPCLVLRDGDRMLACQPGRDPQPAVIHAGGGTYVIPLPAHGRSLRAAG